MNKWNMFIEKRNFKKIFIIYVIVTILCGVVCTGAVGYVFRDKLQLALQYEKTSEVLKKQSSDEEKKQSIDSLAASSHDIYDVLLLDDQNRIVYSAKNSELASGGTFDLKRSEGGRFLQSSQSADTIFRFAKKDEFMLSTILTEDFQEVHDEYDEDYFYRNNFQNKKLYMISLLGKKSGSTKAYIISDPQPVLYGMLTLKIAACVVMLLFMLYWIIIALWVYQNARKSKLSAPVWGILTLFTNLAGVLVYLLYKHINGSCGFCGAVQSRGNVFCTECGKKIGVTCKDCGCFLKPSDHYCPKCGRKRS